MQVCVLTGHTGLGAGNSSRRRSWQSRGPVGRNLPYCTAHCLARRPLGGSW